MLSTSLPAAWGKKDTPMAEMSGMSAGQQPGRLEREEDLDTHEGAHHEDLRVGEVDELQHPVHHGVPEGDESVHEAQDESVEEDLGEDPDQERKVHGASKQHKGEEPLPGPSPLPVHAGSYDFFLSGGAAISSFFFSLLSPHLAGSSEATWSTK